jgi:uncharacterized phage-like protein YoqJ
MWREHRARAREIAHARARQWMDRLDRLVENAVVRMEVLSRDTGHLRLRREGVPGYVDLYITRGTVMEDGRKSTRHWGLDGALALLGVADEIAQPDGVARVQREEPEGTVHRPLGTWSSDMIIAGTGHRPHKFRIGALNGYHPAVLTRLTDLARAALQREKPTRVLSGMALGWDTALVQAALDLSVPFEAYLPFAGQELRWPLPAQRRYHELLSKAARVVTVSEGGYSAEKMHIRNVRLVDDSQHLLALWNGIPGGGTFDCLKYADRVNRTYTNLWQSWIRHATDRTTALLCA